MLRFGLYTYVSSDRTYISPSVVPSTSPSENLSSLTTSVPTSSPSINSIKPPSNKLSMFPPIVLAVYPFSDTRYLPSYVPSVNSSRDPNEQQVGAHQGEIRTTL